MRYLMPPLWALHAIPFFLLGLVLIYLLAFQIQLLPMFGGYSAGAFPGLNVTFPDVSDEKVMADRCSLQRIPQSNLTHAATGRKDRAIRTEGDCPRDPIVAVHVHGIDGVALSWSVDRRSSAIRGEVPVLCDPAVHRVERKLPGHVPGRHGLPSKGSGMRVPAPDAAVSGTNQQG